VDPLRIDLVPAGIEPGETDDARGLYLSAGRRGLEPDFLAARFSLRRCLSVFRGFCFCCFLGLSELLLMTTSEPTTQRLLETTRAGPAGRILFA